MDEKKSIWSAKTLSPHKVKKAIENLLENQPIDATEFLKVFETYYQAIPPERKPRELTDLQSEAAKAFIEDGDMIKFMGILKVGPETASKIVAKYIMADHEQGVKDD